MTRMKIEFVILAVLLGVLLGRIPDTLALRTNQYQFFDTLVDVQGELVKHYVEEPDHKKMLAGAIEGMIKTLKDPHTVYMPPAELEEFDKQTRGTFSGIGAVITVKDGHLTVVSPLDDSPAYKAGVVAGDVIYEIDGKPTEGLSTSQAVKLITGPEGSKVTLKIRHPSNEEVVIVVTRSRIQIQTVKGYRRDKEHHWDYMLDAEAAIGYVQLTQFSGTTADNLAKALDKLKAAGVKGLILDLRFNPGGLLSQAAEIADMFLDKGVIVSTKGRNSPRHVTSAKAQTVGKFPMVVLINEASASASEIVSGALKDNGRAIIVGTRSYGKGSVQQIRGLAGGNGAIKITTAHYYLPSGRNLHRRDGAKTWGVDPNDGFYVPMSYAQMEKMMKIRRETNIVNDDNGKDGPAKITPSWLKSDRSDFQLAAAMETMLAKLKTGTFKPVGQSNASLQSHLTEKANLERTREKYIDGLAKIDKKLKALDQKINDLNRKKPDTGSDKTDKAATPSKKPPAATAP